MMPRIILFICLLLFLINSTFSEIYKWIDENGKTVYGDKPDSNRADRIKIKNPPKQDKYYQERTDKQKKLLKIMEQERNEKIALQNKEKEEEEKRKQKCAELIKELQEMKNAGLLYKDTDDPYNPKIYTNEERETEENKYEKYIRENCS